MSIVKCIYYGSLLAFQFFSCDVSYYYYFFYKKKAFTFEEVYIHQPLKTPEADSLTI